MTSMFRLCILTLLTGMVTVLPAQILVSTSLPAKTFLRYEGIPLRVEIRNNSGEDIVLGATNGNARIEMSVRDMKQRPMPATGKPLLAKPLLIYNGETAALEIDLVQTRLVRFPVSYQVGVAVSFAGESFPSQNLYFDVANGHTHETLKRRKADRTFEVIGLNRNNQDEMILRVSDYKQETTLYTYTLARHLRFYPPEVREDLEGRIHTLHYQSPDSVVHCRFNPDGTPICRITVPVAPGPRVRLIPHPDMGFAVPNAAGTP